MFGMEYLNILNLNQDFLLPSILNKKRGFFFYIILTQPTEGTSKNDQIDTCSNASSSSTFDGKRQKERDMNMNHVYKHFSV